ncbi:conserved hypothetical protein [Tenacibaculum maritimum]|uniref:condensin complex protein MksE n=1 Tax=Tenacibaculum maritimum TaxID=107401 RepID=UPI0012E6AF4F|nr:hypothetical protein [Tenacibaculum maritimum]CAA0173831.1 conserved hypothetical protein [Tenacibaculum maritimum]CAA0207243.1 conserved hypothetical protein [Tenacibaculum maritimum]CAA0224331.1 conserved hypothetical protein [Tenacibaculum maritimum]
MISKYTSDIFHILRKGEFICSNSPDEHIQTLYKILEDEDNFADLHEYFYQINYVLEHGNEYFYFSRKEKNIDLERKLDKAFEWIDILDFFKTFDSSFDVGYRFSPADIVNQLKNNADLKSKLDGFKKIGNEKKKYTERIQKLIEKLEKEYFVSLENEITETYKVLTSFHYLKDIISTINIPEDLDNEIPQ